MRRMAVVVAAVTCLTVSAFATEMGGSAYPNGAEGIMAGALPPPGLYLLNYTTFYSADKFCDGNGNSAIPGFKLEAWANVVRILKVSDAKILGGNWAMHLFVPVANLDVTIPGRSDGSFDIGDVIVDPFILGWHAPPWHFAAGIDCYLPTGGFSTLELANVGRNCFTFEPIFAFTYLNQSGCEVSAKFMYDFNLKNSDTNYQSGQEFHVDYAVARHLKNDWTVGLAGYCYFQTTDDEVAGAPVPPDGNKGKVFALGPTVQYGRGKTNVAFTCQKEFGAENKPEGLKLWLKVIKAF